MVYIAAIVRSKYASRKNKERAQTINSRTELTSFEPVLDRLAHLRVLEADEVHIKPVRRDLRKTIEKNLSRRSQRASIPVTLCTTDITSGPLRFCALQPVISFVAEARRPR